MLCQHAPATLAEALPGHFMFFILISEMRRPQDAMKVIACSVTERQ